MPGNPCPQPSCDERFGVIATEAQHPWRRRNEHRRQYMVTGVKNLFVAYLMADNKHCR